MVQSDIPPQLSIIVVSYNTRDMTLACLASVFAQTRTPFEVIVVDNASTDGSAEAIGAAFPQVRLMAETTNHGFAAAHRLAVPVARAPWLLLLNPDTVVLNGALDKLLAFAERTPDAGIWGGRTLFGDGTLNPTSCWQRMTLASLVFRTLGLSGLFRSSEVFNAECYGTWPRDREREVDIVTGCLFLIRRALWDRLGGFDDRFVMYGEEADLCLRARALGVRPRITPEAEIIHYGGASEKVRTDKAARLLRAKIELIRRHFPPLTRGLGLTVFRLWPFSRYVGMGLAGRLLRRPGLVEQGRAWKEIWDRRADWWNGLGSA